MLLLTFILIFKFLKLLLELYLQTLQSLGKQQELSRLIMTGSGNAAVASKLLQFVTETEHEKIIRAISLALGMIYI